MIKIAVITACLMLVLASHIALADVQTGVPALENGNHDTAMSDLMARAEGGHYYAQYTVGMMFTEGRGVEKDLAVAVQWLRRSAEGAFREIERAQTGNQDSNDMIRRQDERIRELEETINRIRGQIGPGGVLDRAP